MVFTTNGLDDTQAAAPLVLQRQHVARSSKCLGAMRRSYLYLGRDGSNFDEPGRRSGTENCRMSLPAAVAYLASSSVTGSLRFYKSPLCPCFGQSQESRCPK